MIGWLRDHTLGPAPTPQAALIRLRAVQAALFVRGILLRWQAGALGPDPARQLLGDLTPVIAAQLHATCRTDAAAATALALHLNHTCRDFDYLTMSDIAPDGSAVRGPGQPGPTGIPTLTHPGYSEDRTHGLPAASRTPPGTSSPSSNHSSSPHTPTRSSPPIWPTGAVKAPPDTDPYFVHPQQPGWRSPEGSLRASIKRTCRTLGLDPPWLHGGGCINGADIGLNRRTAGWSTERGLSVIALDHVLHQLPQPCRILNGGPPRWVSTGLPT